MNRNVLIKVWMHKLHLTVKVSKLFSPFRVSVKHEINAVLTLRQHHHHHHLLYTFIDMNCLGVDSNSRPCISLCSHSSSSELSQHPVPFFCCDSGLIVHGGEHTVAHTAVVTGLKVLLLPWWQLAAGGTECLLQQHSSAGPLLVDQSLGWHHPECTTGDRVWEVRARKETASPQLSLS